MRLFEVMGGWVRGVPDVDLKIRVHGDAHKHAWHAELWRQRLPGLDERAHDRLTVPPSDGLEAVMEELSVLGSEDAMLQKLVGLYWVVLPHLVSTYRHHRRTATAVTDGPDLRILDLVLHDEEEDWIHGELLVRSLLGSEHDVHQAAACGARLGSRLMAAGGDTLTPPVW